VEDTIIAAKIIVYAGENEQYYSFITPEAFEALEEWMEYRRTSGEDINGESWLMRTVWDTTTPNKTIRSPKKMSEGAIKMLIGRALRSVGLRTVLDKKVTRRHEFKTNHGFRKFFQTNAEPKMKSLDVMTLMGQDTGLAASYKPTVEMLLEGYLKAADNLTIYNTPRLNDMSRNQQALATDIQAKAQEIQALRNEMTQSKQEKEQQFKKMMEEMRTLRELCKHSLELSSKQNSTISDANAKFDKLMDEYNHLKGLLDKSMSTTKTAFGRIEELERDMRGGLLIKLGRGTIEELDRRVKILLQVALAPIFYAATEFNI
jgi:hypothetical protein